MNREEKDWLTENVNSNTYFKLSLIHISRNTRFRIIRALQSLATKRLQYSAKKHSNIPL